LNPPLEVAEGLTVKGRCPCGTTYTIVNYSEENGSKCPIQVMAQLGKAGGCAATVMAAVSALATLALEHGATPERVAEELKSIRCARAGPDELSCVECVAQALEYSTNGDSGE